MLEVARACAASAVPGDAAHAQSRRPGSYPKSELTEEMECWPFREALVPSPRSLFLEAQGLCEVTSGSREEAGTTGAL